MYVNIKICNCVEIFDWLLSLNVGVDGAVELNWSSGLWFLKSK